MSLNIAKHITSLSILGLCAAPLTAHAYVIKAPWRGDSLPAGQYLSTSFAHGSAYPCKDDPTKSCAMDFRGWRFNGTAWTDSETSSAPTSLDQYIGWDMPIYSPVDGEIVACWRNMPDDVLGGDEPPACGDQFGYGPPPEGCMGGGNHVLIKTDDGHMVFLAHMKQWSVPAALCDHPDNAPLPGQTVPGVDSHCAMSGYDGWRESTLLTTPIPVRKGELVGRVGNSGNSDVPHLHIDVREYEVDVNGDYCVAEVPWEFTETWRQEKIATAGASADAWERLEGELPAYDGDSYLVYADPQAPRIDDLDLEDGSLPALAMTPAGGVVAFRNATGNLEAVGFKFDVNSDFDIGLGDEDVAASDIDIARINNTDAHVVAVARTSTDKLRLVPYFMQSDADLVVGNATTTTTTATLVGVTRAPTHSGVVVALKNSTNDLTVRDYATSIAGETISLTAGGSDSTSDDITHLDIDTIVMGRGASQTTGAWKGVVTGERRTGGALYLRTFSVSSTGATVTEVDSANVVDLATNSSFNANDVDVAVTGNLGGREYVVVSSILAANNNLRVQTWEVSNTGVLDLIEQIDGGPVTHLSSARAGYQDVMVGARLTGGDLTMLSFNVSSDGSLRRVGTNDAGGIMSLALDGRVTQDDVVVACPLSANGEVRLIHYPTNYSFLH